MSRAYLGLGSNIGDRIGYIQQATQMLGEFEGVEVIKTSSFYETEPYGFKEQSWFMNAVMEVEVKITPVELLRICQNVEQNLGRERTSNKWGPRVIDIDILLYDDKVLDDELLKVPHPATYDRAYCLVPMLEIAKYLEHPVLKKTISDIHKQVENPEEVYLYGTRPNDIR